MHKFRFSHFLAIRQIDETFEKYNRSSDSREQLTTIIASLQCEHRSVILPMPLKLFCTQLYCRHYRRLLCSTRTARIVDSKGGWMETPTVKHSSDDFNEKVISTVIFGWRKPLILFSNKAYHRFNSYHSRDNNKISSSRLLTVTANGFLRVFPPTSFKWQWADILK